MGYHAELSSKSKMVKYISTRLCLFLAYAVLLEAFDPALNTQWEAYQLQYSRQYDAQEEFYRRELWEMNLECIEAHNSQPGVTYTMGVNSFTDMTPAEIRTRLGLNAEDRDTCSDLTRTLASADITGLHRQVHVPETVDLREAG